jgi:hypothetical protein
LLLLLLLLHSFHTLPAPTDLQLDSGHIMEMDPLAVVSRVLMKAADNAQVSSGALFTRCFLPLLLFLLPPQRAAVAAVFAVGSVLRTRVLT